MLIQALFIVSLAFSGPEALAAPKKKCPFYLAARRQFLDKSFVIAPPRKGSRISKVKVAFFDADSTLRRNKKGGPFVRNPGDVKILKGVAEKLRELNDQGYLVAIVSNQLGVTTGQLSFKQADQNLLQTVMLLREEGAIVHYFDFAESKNFNRKPEGGMADNLERVLAMDFPEPNPVKIDWKNSFMVGDAAYMKGELRPDKTKGNDHTNADRLFAEGIEVKFEEPRYFFGWKKKKTPLFE